MMKFKQMKEEQERIEFKVFLKHVAQASCMVLY